MAFIAIDGSVYDILNGGKAKPARLYEDYKGYGSIILDLSDMWIVIILHESKQCDS